MNFRDAFGKSQETLGNAIMNPSQYLGTRGFRNSFRYKDGGEVKSLKPDVLPPGPIQGPGTAKSDSIPTKLKVHDFILPAEVVQAIGPDKLQAMVSQFEQEGPQEDSMENGEEIPAQVSNGEFRVPANVVEKTGPEYWDKLVMQVTGHPAQPEISQEGVKAENGYSPDSLSGQRQASQDFWNQQSRSVAPTPGRANPVNPSEVMQARLANSANNAATQAQGLRSQINQNVSLKPAPQLPSLPSNVTSSPINQPQPIKGNMDGMSSEMGIASGLAYDVLTAPEIAKGRDDAIATLKAKGGFSPTATPFKYASGGYVDPEEELARLERIGNTGNAKVNPASLRGRVQNSNPNFQFGNSPVEPGKQMAVGSRNLVPTGQGNVASGGPEFRVKDSMFRNTEGVTVGDPYTQSSSRSLATVPKSPEVDPWTAGAKETSFPKLNTASLKNAAKSVGQGIKNTVTDPAFFIPAADAANQALMERGLQSGNPGYTEAARVPLSLASRAPSLLAEQIAGPQGEGIIPRAFDAVGNKLTDFYAQSQAVRAQRGNQQTPENTQATPKASVANPEQDNATIQQPPKPSLATEVAQPDATRNITGKPVGYLDDQGFYTVTGKGGGILDKDGKVIANNGVPGKTYSGQVLDWNTTQNSLQQTMGADDYNRLQAQNQDYRNQRNNAVIGGTTTSEQDKNGYKTLLNTDSFSPNTGLSLGARQERDVKPEKYDPAFNQDESNDLPQDATDQDRIRVSTMPKKAWQQFMMDLAGDNDAKARETRVQRFAEASGISPNVLKYKLGLAQ